MKKLVLGAVVLMAVRAFAGYTYKLTSGTGYYDDAAQWGNPTSFGTDFTLKGTVHVVATNNNRYSSKSLAILQLQGSVRLDVESGGTVSTGSGGNGLKIGQTSGQAAVCVIQSGGTLSGSLHADGPGVGIVTNCGTWKPDQSSIGNGTYVHQGGTMSLGTNPKTLTVGCSSTAGRSGTLEIASGTFSWWRNANYLDLGLLSVGTSAGTGTIVVPRDSIFKPGRVSIGKNGTIMMRGGQYVNDVDNGDRHAFLIYLGATEEGYGVIRGWGQFVGSSSNTQDSRSIDILFRKGEIVADGEGDESHVLECGSGVHTASNYFAGVSLTTSGWRAENKGALRFPGSALYGDGDSRTLTGCIGCTTTLAKPDIVNAVRVSVTRLNLGFSWNVGVELLAADRTDAHTNALPAGCNVLSVHRIGAFKGSWTDANKVATWDNQGLSVSIRYDQTKLSEADSRLKLWRYSESTGRWTALTELGRGERPEDCVIGASLPYAMSAETFNLGTFAVTECPTKGVVLIVR